MKIKKVFIIIIVVSIFGFISTLNVKQSNKIQSLQFYVGNESDIKITKIYLDNKELEKIPDKANNIKFYRGECTNNSDVSWNYDEWSLVFNTLNSPTSCVVYFNTIINDSVENNGSSSDNTNDNTDSSNESSDSKHNNPETGATLNFFVFFLLMIGSVSLIVYMKKKGKFKRI